MLRIYQFIILLYTSLSTFNASGQPYQSIFGKDSTSWSSVVEIFDGRFTQELVCYNQEQIVSGLTYKIVNQNYINNFAFLIREDTMTGSLWLKSNQAEEILLMTLSLAVGDTFVSTSADFIRTNYIVKRVYLDSLNRKVIQFNQRHNVFNATQFPDSNIMFIEGVGPSTGINYPSFSPSLDVLLCTFKDDTKTYTNSLYLGSCFVGFISLNEPTYSKQLKVSPNPANDKIIITYDGENIKKGTICIKDLQGKLLLNQPFVENEQLDVSNLNAGVYFVFIQSEIGHSKPVRWIKW
jgi:hypothetical protein